MKIAIPPSGLTWSSHFLKSVPDNAPYEHDYEGGRYAFAYQIFDAGRIADAAGPQRTAAVGNVAGIWLGEHRIHGSRKIIATLQGE
jgi:thiamine phosphate synthase YjbQ (UPF0047 family)